MLLQNQNGVCGAFAVANALLLLRLDFSIAEIKRVAKTTPENGTSKRGIIRAIEYYELEASVYEGYSEEAAWKWILKWSLISPIIVLVDNRQHYATCIGRFGNQIILSDPSVPDEEFENNVLVLEKQEFISRWRWGGRFYAIRVKGHHD